LPPKNYEKLKPTAIGDVKFESIHGFDRLYQITAVISYSTRSMRVFDLTAPLGQRK